MGLDMTLTARQYVSKYFDEELSTRLNTLAQELNFPSGDVNAIEIEAIYWRKANAIHDWFVRECQGGVDECQQTYVGREKLLQLKAVCEAVLTNRRDAPKLLPTASGFFFGSTDYDDYYIEDLKSTIQIIDDALTLPENWDFEYHSSW